MSGCVVIGGALVHINSPTTVYTRHVKHCPTEGRRRRMVQSHALWYDPDLTCLGCGDRWSFEGRAERPFQRGWRAERIKYARTAWAHAVTAAECRAWLRAELDATLGEPA